MVDVKYTRPEMKVIWDKDNIYRNWLNIELLVVEALEEFAEIPGGTANKIKEKANYDIKRIEEIEEDIKHSYVAFLKNVGDHLGDNAKFIHRGVTSSDVQDTGFSLQLKQASELIVESIDRVLKVLHYKIVEHKTTLCVGRSHGVHAEPTSFGLKLLNHYLVFKRARERMVRAIDEIAVCSLSGNVGTYSNLSPKVEEYVADKLGLYQGAVGTQVASRDRHAYYFATLGVIAASIENLSVEFRHLQRTEVGEIEEPFEIWGRSSTAMPHRHTPVIAERISGLARIIRSTVSPALENVSMWHESDVSYCAVENITAPKATIYLDFALNKMADLISGMKVMHRQMINNLESSKGLIFSHQVLVELVKAGMPREYAYNIVREMSEKVYLGTEDEHFPEIVKDNESVMEYLDRDALNKIFDYSSYFARITEVIDKVLEEHGEESDYI